MGSSTSPGSSWGGTGPKGDAVVVAGRRRYSDADRSSALAKLAENGGNVYRTARELGIPEVTLRSWANGDRHPEASQQCEGRKSDLADRWEKVANAALDVLDKSAGDLRPRDAATVGGIATDKMMLLRGEAPAGTTVVVVKIEGDWAERL
jgi:transposase-like protein